MMKRQKYDEVAHNLCVPDDIVKVILRFITFPKVLNCRLVCKKWISFVQNTPITLSLYDYKSVSSFENLFEIFHEIDYIDMVVQTPKTPYSLQSFKNVTNLKNFQVQCNTDTYCPLPPQSLASSLQTLAMIGTPKIPLDQISQFKKLKTLKLTPYHAYTATELDTLDSLPELRSLDISLSGISESLGKLTTLQELCILGCPSHPFYFDIVIPQLTNLNLLFFRADAISSEQFKCLQYLPNLTDLRVQVLRVDSNILSTLCIILPRLENFTVMQGVFQEVDCFPKLEKMSKISFFRCRFSDNCFETFLSKLNPFCFKTLKIVDLFNTSVSLKSLSHLTCLSSLHIENTTGFGDLQSLNTGISELKIPDLKFQTQELAICQNLTQLKTLDLSQTQTTTESLIHLGGLTNLASLVLDSCPISSLEHLSSLINLKTLLLNQTQITDAGLSPIIKMPKLAEIQLMYCNTLTDKCIEFISQVSYLSFLVLPPCTSDSSLKNLETSTFLEYISFIGCQNVSQESIKVLYEYIKPCAFHFNKNNVSF